MPKSKISVPYKKLKDLENYLFSNGIVNEDGTYSYNKGYSDEKTANDLGISTMTVRIRRAEMVGCLFVSEAKNFAVRDYNKEDLSKQFMQLVEDSAQTKTDLKLARGEISEMKEALNKMLNIIEQYK